MSKWVKGAILGGLIGGGAAVYRSYLNDEPIDELATKAATTAGAAAAAGALVGLVFDRRTKSRASNASVLLGYAAAQRDRLTAAGVKGNKRAQRKAAKAQKQAAKKIAKYEKEFAKNMHVFNAKAQKQIAKARKSNPAFNATYSAATNAASAASPVVSKWMKRAQPYVVQSQKNVKRFIDEGTPAAMHAFNSTRNAAAPLAATAAEKANEAVDALTPLAREAADRAAKQYYKTSKEAAKLAKKTAKNSKPFIENAKEWANDAKAEAAKAAAEREKRKPIVVKVG